MVNYNLKAVYYIARSDLNNIKVIQESIEAAKETYLNWQRTKIGRDINPDALTEFVRTPHTVKIFLFLHIEGIRKGDSFRRLHFGRKRVFCPVICKFNHLLFHRM